MMKVMMELNDGKPSGGKSTINDMFSGKFI
jgi:hypothetical protein